MTCVLADGSLARGCHISATPFGVKYHQGDSSVNVVEANISRSNTAASNASGELVIDSAPAECYSLTVCDWEEDGSIGDVCIGVYEPQGKLAVYCDWLYNSTEPSPSQTTAGITTETGQPVDFIHMRAAWSNSFLLSN